MESTIGLKSILGWERLPLFGRYGYVEIIKCLMIRTLPSCRLSTGLLLYSVCGRLCSVWRIATFIQRSVHDWKLRRGILFSNMDSRIAYGLVLLLRRYYICAPLYVILSCFLWTSDLEWGCVHPSYAEAGCMLNNY
jgi:hypothetical protein